MFDVQLLLFLSVKLPVYIVKSEKKEEERKQLKCFSQAICGEKVDRSSASFTNIIISNWYRQQRKKQRQHHEATSVRAEFVVNFLLKLPAVCSINNVKVLIFVVKRINCICLGVIVVIVTVVHFGHAEILVKVAFALTWSISFSLFLFFLLFTHNFSHSRNPRKFINYHYNTRLLFTCQLLQWKCGFDSDSISFSLSETFKWIEWTFEFFCVSIINIWSQFLFVNCSFVLIAHRIS